MDNSYYTGATLIRASGGGGLKYPPPNLPLAGPPLLMQPNVLTGAPLIRNGQQTTNGPGHPGQSSPPSIICCFQPIYYIPSPPGPGTLNFNNVRHSANGKQIHSPPGNQNKQNHPPKRKNYKTLQKLKPIKNNFEEDLTRSNGGETEEYKKIALPDPISPPAKTVALSRPRRESSSSSTSSTSSSVNSPAHFFTSSIESTKDTSNEEKQRNEKLLNFYFYEEHWRPKECDDETQNTNQQLDTSSSWEIKQNQEQSFGCCSVKTSNSPSPSTIQRQKDLEVEAQIVTLANGHRDLEIRLCYVTS